MCTGSEIYINQSIKEEMGIWGQSPNLQERSPPNYPQDIERKAHSAVISSRFIFIQHITMVKDYVEFDRLILADTDIFIILNRYRYRYSFTCSYRYRYAYSYRYRYIGTWYRYRYEYPVSVEPYWRG